MNDKPHNPELMAADLIQSTTTQEQIYPFTEITLRDLFAAVALLGLMEGKEGRTDCQGAYETADRMLIERQKRNDDDAK